MGKVTTIYGLVDPRDGLVHYVGKTIQKLSRRMMTRLGKTRHKHEKTHVVSWIKNVVKFGLKPIPIILEIVAENNDGTIVEKKWINHYRHLYPGILTNATDGGDGLHNPSSETRAKMSAAKIGYIPWMKGKKHSDESKLKCSLGNKGRFIGRFVSEETRKKMSLSLTGRKLSQESKQKIAFAKKTNHTPQNPITGRFMKTIPSQATFGNLVEGVTITNRGYSESHASNIRTSAPPEREHMI